MQSWLTEKNLDTRMRTLHNLSKAGYSVSLRPSENLISSIMLNERRASTIILLITLSGSEGETRFSFSFRLGAFGVAGTVTESGENLLKS